MDSIQNIQVCVKTDIGFKREKNEDSYLIIIEDIFLKMEKVKRGDTFLLCSDGLNDMLTDLEIKNVLSKSYTLKDKCNGLVAKALAMGGKDNVTVIVFQV